MRVLGNLLIRGLSSPFRKRRLSALFVGISVLTFRLAFLPIYGIPEPTVPDEFSYLLMGKTFASGRITNPTHPLWTHFETLFVLHTPSYASIYPVAQGLFLALGETFAGHPWFGVWLSAGLMCAGVCWMLQGWFPPLWGLFGGILVSIQLGISSYWMNSYWGGAPAALGGALVYGALPRMLNRKRIKDPILMGLGIGLLANSRPYEGFIAVIPAVLYLVYKWRKQTGRIAVRTQILPLILTLTVIAAISGYYFWRVTGNALVLPQQAYMRQYAAGPPFLWQSSVPTPAYRHETLRDAHLALSHDYARYDSAAAVIRGGLFKLGQALNFLLGPLLVLPILLVPVLLRSRMRFLCVSAAFFIAGMLLAVPFQPHYAAPITAVLYALAVQALRYLWLLRRYGNPAGRILVPLMPIACVSLLFTAASPESRNSSLVSRASIVARLQATLEPHVVFVRYGSRHLLSDEWVYNEPDIDTAPIVWARDMGPEENLGLLRYFRNRRAILLKADESPPAMERYRDSEMAETNGAAKPAPRRPL